MINSLKNYKVKLLITATILSLIFGVLTIKTGTGHVLNFGFPGTFITLNKQILELPGINPIQFAGNVGILYLILFYLSKAFRRFVPAIRKRKSDESGPSEEN